MQKQIEEKQTTIVITGDFSIYEAAEAKSLLLENTDGFDRDVVLNLEQVEHLDCAGVQVLLMLKKEVQHQGGSLQLAAVSESAAEVFSFFNLSSPFTDEEAA